MLLSGGVRDVVPVAHPVTGHPHLDVPVALIATGAFLLVVAVGLAVPLVRRPLGAGPEATTGTATDAGGDVALAVRPSWQGQLGRARWVVRVVVLALLVLAVVAARIGTESETENIAPALLVGVAWPAVFLGTLLVGSLWRWIDPWDTLARFAGADDRPAGDDVRPAVLVALAVLWYLAVHPRPFDPRTLGAVVTAYTVLTVAGCLVLGRRRWLSTAEPVGIVLSTVAGARPTRGPLGEPPRGLHVLLGVFAGGSLFTVLRRTELWADLGGVEHPQLAAAAGFLVTCAVGGSMVALQGWLTQLLADRRAGPAARHAVALAVAPAVVGIVVAVGLARNRLTTSLQLLPGLLGDPFGRGWDLLGDPTAGLDPAPLGAAGLLAVQLVVLVGAHLWGAVLAARLLPRQHRLPVVLLLGQLVAAGVAGLALH